MFYINIVKKICFAYYQTIITAGFNYFPDDLCLQRGVADLLRVRELHRRLALRAAGRDGLQLPAPQHDLPGTVRS